MQTLDHDQVTGHVTAPPEAVHALVADVTRTPELGPEIVRCAWLIIRAFGGGADQRAVIRAGMERTVARIRETGEREAR